jgi:hypothetical protein
LQSSQANSGCILSGVRRVRPVVVGWSSRNLPPPCPSLSMIIPDACSLPHGLGQLPEKLGRSAVAGGHCMVVRSESLRAQSARHRVDQPTISGRSCANSGHYKPLFACVDRTFVKSISSRRRPEKKEHRRRGWHSRRIKYEIVDVRTFRGVRRGDGVFGRSYKRSGRPMRHYTRRWRRSAPRGEKSETSICVT